MTGALQMLVDAMLADGWERFEGGEVSPAQRVFRRLSSCPCAANEWLHVGVAFSPCCLAAMRPEAVEPMIRWEVKRARRSFERAEAEHLTKAAA